MTFYWLTDTEGTQYINHPGHSDHGSISYDGMTWEAPESEAELALRQKRMDTLMERSNGYMEAKRKRLGNWAARENRPLIGQTLSAQIESLRKREKACWDMSEVFLHSRDAHGLHDMGVEIQGIQWAIRELEKVVT